MELLFIPSSFTLVKHYTMSKYGMFIAILELKYTSTAVSGLDMKMLESQGHGVVIGVQLALKPIPPLIFLTYGWLYLFVYKLNKRRR
jgi:hypothetical protein